MRIGLTTQSFMTGLKSGQILTEDIIRFAHKLGLDWVEVRDQDISFSVEYLKELKKLADSLELRLHYAWDGVDMSKEAEFDRLHKALKNAVVFGEGTMCRVVIAPELLIQKNGYSSNEFEKICSILDRATSIAAENGIIMVYENSHEPLKGEENKSFGLQEILDTLPVTKITFDPGNIMCEHKAKTIPKRFEVEDFYSKYAANIPYVHLKCTNNHILQNTLITDGDIDLQHLIQQLKNKAIYCIELPDPLDINVTKSNIQDGFNLVKTWI